MKLLLLLTSPVMFPQLAHFKCYNKLLHFIFYKKKGKVYFKHLCTPLHSTLHISGFLIYRSNQPWITKIWGKKCDAVTDMFYVVRPTNHHSCLDHE